LYLKGGFAKIASTLLNAGHQLRVGVEKTVEEQQLAELIVEVLNLEDIDAGDIEPDDNLFDGGLGLDSIDALEIAVAVSQNYGVHIKAEDEETKVVFRSLRSLSQFISEQRSS